MAERWIWVALALRAAAAAEHDSLLAVIVVYLAGAYLVLRSTQRARYAIAWSIVGTLAIVLAALAAREGDAIYALFVRTASELSTGPHWIAAHTDWVEASGATGRR